jgi:hypothetical protein
MDLQNQFFFTGGFFILIADFSICNLIEQGAANFTELAGDSYSKEGEALQHNRCASLIPTATPVFFLAVLTGNRFLRNTI